MKIKTRYYIDYVYNQTIGENFYHTLVRTRDEAILYSNKNLQYVIDYAKNELNINGKEITVL